jgi:glycosyltransferase involved in cell wall biosynthesis
VKICLVIESYPPNVTGGVSVYGQRLAHGLANAGHEVFVITSCPFISLSSLKPSEEMDGKVRVLHIPPINIYDAYKSKNVPTFIKPIFHIINLWNPAQHVLYKNILRQERPDVVHIHDIYGISLSFLDAVKSLRIPLILTLHSFGLLCRKVTLLNRNSEICESPNRFCSLYSRAIKEIIDSKPDIVTAPSQFLLDYHTNHGFFPRSKRIKLANGIETDFHEYIPKDKSDHFNILFVGRLGIHKGAHILIKAILNIANICVRLQIIGDGDYRIELEQLAKNDERIIFYGTIPNKEITHFYRMADVTVVPSLCYDNAPLVIQESFRNGTPVIGSRIGGIPEMIIHGYNGLLFDPGNVDELMQILQDLMSNRKEIGKMGENSRESLEIYSIHSHIKQVLQIYGLAKDSR